MKIHLYNYKNYYNRYSDKFDTIQGYSPYLIKTLFDVHNFDYGDGINVTHNINYYDTDVKDKCNYVIVEADDGSFTRWYVIDGNHLRDDKEYVQLKRDVVADFWTFIKNADCYVKKAILKGNGFVPYGYDPLIFNKENFSLNQVKTDEVLIKRHEGPQGTITDYDNIPWVVGFMDNKTQDVTTRVVFKDGSTVHRFRTLSEFPLYTYLQDSTTLEFPTSIYFGGDGNISIVATQDGSTLPMAHWTDTDYKGLVFNIRKGYDWHNCVASSKSATDSAIKFDGDKAWLNSDGSITSITFGVQPAGRFIKSVLASLEETDEVKLAKENVNGKIVDITDLQAQVDKYSNGYIYIEDTDTVYKLSSSEVLRRETKVIDLQNLMGEDEPELDKYVSGVYWKAQNDSDFFFTQSGSGLGDIKCSALFKNISVSFDEQYGGYYQYKMSAKARQLSDAPYKMFCLPLGDFTYSNVSTTADMTNLIAADISTYHTGTDLLDLQVVPYCPFRFGGSFTYDVDYSPIYEEYTGGGHGTVGRIYWCSSCQGSFEFTIPISPLTYENLKVSNEAEFYRLCAPDYSNVYEYSLAKNVYNNDLYVYYYYKPYSSSTIVVPKYTGYLYNKPFNADGRADARGLICTGGFAMTQSGDAFAQYERQNVNYMKAFNREIKSIDLQNQYQSELEKWQLISGVISGASSGASTISTVGGAIGGGLGAGIGAGIGAVAGGVGSYLVGQHNRELNENLRDEAKDLKQDLFGYNLGNIKALPNTLSTITSMTQANKYFPYVERYCCTERELQMIKDKITFNGMTVNAIGKYIDYKDNRFQRYPDVDNTHNFFQAQLIHLDNISPTERFNGDYHVVNTIADELAKGIYVPINID